MNLRLLSLSKYLISNLKAKTTHMKKEHDIDNMMAQLLLQYEEQYGNTIKSYWFHESDFCPSCGRKVDFFKVKRGQAISLNGFLYRQRNVLLGYFLCGRCAKRIHQDARLYPGVETEQHAKIELTLITAYHQHMNALDS